MAETPSTMWLQQIAERLQRMRSALNLTQRELAEQTGIKPNTYNQWEAGTHPPELSKAMRLREVYGVTLDWIYCGDAGGLPSALQQKIASARLPAPEGRRRAKGSAAERVPFTGAA